MRETVSVADLKEYICVCKWCGFEVEAEEIETHLKVCKDFND